LRTILVTGGAGFIGSNFVEYILKKYPHYKVLGLEQTIRWYKDNKRLWQKQIPLRRVPVKARDGSVI